MSEVNEALEQSDDADKPFAVSPEGEVGAAAEEIIGGTRLGVERSRFMQTAHRGNPDDPPVRIPLGNGPGPNYSNAPGRLALVQGQVYIVGVLLVVQLWLITTTLYELLSGNRGGFLWLMTAASFACFIISVVVWRLPRRPERVRG